VTEPALASEQSKVADQLLTEEEKPVIKEVKTEAESEEKETPTDGTP